jgi:hypothetical protein
LSRRSLLDRAVSDAHAGGLEVRFMRLTTIGLMGAVLSLTAAMNASAALDRPEAGGAPSRATVREVTLPAGTRLPVVLEKSVGSDISRVEERVSAHVARAVRIGGVTAVPQGSRIEGVVTDATRSGKVKGRAHIGLRFESLAVGGGERYAVRTAAVGRIAPATKKKDALTIGLPAAGGAIVGGLLGGKKGAAIGGAAGGGAGTAAVLTTRGKEVRLPRGTPLTIRLAAPLTVRVRG